MCAIGFLYSLDPDHDADYTKNRSTDIKPAEKRHSKYRANVKQKIDSILCEQIV